MLTRQGIRTRITDLITDTDAATVTLVNNLVNETHHHILTRWRWPFLEVIGTRTTVASTATYRLPHNYGKMLHVTTTIAGIEYPVEIVEDLNLWLHITARGTSNTSEPPQYVFLSADTAEFWPVPSTAGRTITFYYTRRVVDFANDDYTTGTIDALANGASAVTGAATVWTAGFVGRYLRITSNGFWYEISARTSNTAITIIKTYAGTTITAPGGEAYTIGELPVIPEEFHELLIWRPVAFYYLQKERQDLSRVYFDLFETGMTRMQREFGTKSHQFVIPPRGTLREQSRFIDPNDPPQTAVIT
ncbi:MAG: hypothetical protein QME66_05495 [Candidatus Eisenbacteria bacterium]|nr:hypothetical protein [Candidatus Eisenbacteria bacterium]